MLILSCLGPRESGKQDPIGLEGIPPEAPWGAYRWSSPYHPDGHQRLPSQADGQETTPGISHQEASPGCHRDTGDYFFLGKKILKISGATFQACLHENNTL